MSLEFPKVDLSGVNEAMGNLNDSLEKFAEDIQKRKDNAMAMAFTRHICDLLSENGVVVEVTEIEQTRNAENRFEAEYGFVFTGLDFSEHDKMVAEEKDKKIEKLEDDLNRLTVDLKNRMGQIYELREEIKMLKEEKDSLAEMINDLLEDDTSELEEKLKNACCENQQLKITVDVLSKRIAELMEVHQL